MSSHKGSFSFFWLACPANLNIVLCLLISERLVFNVSYTTCLITSQLRLCPAFCVTCFNSFDSSFDFPFWFRRNIVFKIFLQKKICFKYLKSLYFDGPLAGVVMDTRSESSAHQRMTLTARKVSKYGVFSGPYFPAFGLNTETYGENLHIKSRCGKIRTRKNSVWTVWTVFTQCFRNVVFLITLGKMSHYLGYYY